ncbi:5'-methylthioadenosine/S-adenosylhomocysteine nucleosidase [Sporanaerobium hydrogeniformans]|uniref:5'-methylthioadenosine/S-adenosylhomocysteine nucleosidase n=1 Tax=Sporanaerobium hydrogeniformans TaxID=3072179 RepID=A0AC61D6F8_9FIRM|nr:5'-methylthioadenosine/adenosylhomocysteine nucleosidase [Sporanaerobium hydrogeniformans]PHV69285.1 5'-methylthioadenosine/S-adenosylhomocysteine nucleosidase [Sporanaerobium hydrogeniformans]
MIGIIGAMEEEVISLKRKVEEINQQTIAGMDFYTGKLHNKDVVIVRCGIGKVNAAVCTQVLVDKFNADYIINTGVAGGLYPEINIGDIVVSSDTVEHDMDASAVGNPRGEIPRMNKTYFEADERLVECAKKAAENLKGEHKVYVGRIASGDQFISSIRVKEDIYTTFTAYCAEMEGAAIAHTCFLNQVPFVIIRAISDKADSSADVNFEEFVNVAAKNASRMIEAMIKEIK